MKYIMKCYDVYNFQTDEKICTVFATDVVSAEIKACIEYNMRSEEVYALSREE